MVAPSLKRLPRYPHPHHKTKFQRGESEEICFMPDLRIENEYLRTPDFLKFSMTTEFSVLMFLLASIVRDSQGNNVPSGARKMNEEYYQKGMLCASYGMNNIARYFGWFVKNKKTGELEPNRGNVSRKIKVLEKMGLLKIIRVQTPIGEKFIYHLGNHINGKEKLFFDDVFKAKAKLNRIQKSMEVEKRQNEMLQKPDSVKETEAEIASLMQEQQKRAEDTLRKFTG